MAGDEAPLAFVWNGKTLFCWTSGATSTESLHSPLPQSNQNLRKKRGGNSKKHRILVGGGESCWVLLG